MATWPWTTWIIFCNSVSSSKSWNRSSKSFPKSQLQFSTVINVSDIELCACFDSFLFSRLSIYQGFSPERNNFKGFSCWFLSSPPPPKDWNRLALFLPLVRFMESSVSTCFIPFKICTSGFWMSFKKWKRSLLRNLGQKEGPQSHDLPWHQAGGFRWQFCFSLFRRPTS